jgi:hypothetical protein
LNHPIIHQPTTTTQTAALKFPIYNLSKVKSNSNLKQIYSYLFLPSLKTNTNMPQNWTTQDIISLIKFINFIWRRIEKTEEHQDDTSILEALETKLQHLSEALEYLRREAEHKKSILFKDSERRKEVGIILGQLSIDLNVLDIMVGRMKGGLVVDEENFDGLGEGLEGRLEEMNVLLDKVRRAENGGLNWALHGITNSWHHVHWADLVEVRYPKDEFYQVEHEKEVLKLDLRKDDEFDYECITVFVRFQDNGFGTKIRASNLEIVAPKSTSLGDLKKAIREKIGVPICQQLLSHSGSMLDNGKNNQSILLNIVLICCRLYFAGLWR